VVAGLCAFVCAAQSSTPPAKKTPAKSATAVKTTPTTKPAASKTGSTTAHKTVRKTTPVVHTAAKPRQLQPTAQRYHEIQDALVAKGYLRPEQATGNWDQASVDALKRFQAEQKLDASGKITSMTLIALGLGPKHEAEPLPLPPPPVQANFQER